LADDDLSVLEFWNKRASLAEVAGTPDLMAKQLEIKIISKHIKEGQKILEIGCGNGMTAIELARRFDINLTGIDFSEKMISEARRLASENHLGADVVPVLFHGMKKGSQHLVSEIEIGRASCRERV